MNNRKLILPVILILSLILTGWAYHPKETIKEQTAVIDQLSQEISKIEQLPSGSQFTLTISDADLTGAAGEFLETYKTEIEQTLKQYANVNLKVSEPKVTFSAGGFKLSLKVGISFVKVTASAEGTITLQNGTPIVTLTSVDVPVVSVPVADVNATIQSYVNQYAGSINNAYTILSIETQEGYLTITGIKK